MAAGFRQGGRGSGAGFQIPGPNTVQPRRGFLKFLLGAAVLAGGGAVLMNTDFSEPAAPDPTPEQIADYFIDIVLPREAANNNRRMVLPAAERAALREALIRYEQIELKAEDVFTYYDDIMNEDEKKFVRERVDYHLGRNLAPGLAGIRAMQDLQLNKQISRKELNPMPSPDYTYEIYMRNRRYNDAYGTMNDAQARELGNRLREDWKLIQERKTVIDFYTDTTNAHRRGLRNYWSCRDWTIQHARRELKDGTFDQSIAESRRRSGVAPPAPPAPAPSA